MHNRTFHLIRIMALILLLLQGCRIEVRDFSDELVLETIPAGRNQILPTDLFPSVLLSSKITHESGESVLSVTREEKALPGTRSWEGDRLTFIPDDAFLPACRYYLNLTGNLSDSQGRLFPVNTSIPFFSECVEAQGFTISDISPPSGSTLSSRDTELRVCFSQPVLKESLEEALFISPNEEVDISWNRDTDSCVIIPKYGWDDATTYTVSFFQDRLSSSEGLFLQSSEEYSYRADLTRGQETTAQLSVVKFDWHNGFPPIVPATGEVGPADTIQIDFDRPVNQKSVEAVFTILPYCSGSLYWKGESTAVFIPERDFQTDTTYHVEISESVPLSPGENTFTTPPVLPEVLSVWGDGDDQFPESLDSLPADAISISPSGAHGTYSFFFSYPEKIPDKMMQQKLQHRCSITSLFPPDIPPPELVGFMWSGPDSLIVQARGIGSMHQSRVCFYTLTLPDGGDRARSLTLRFCP